MKITEYRIPVPLTFEEFRVGQRYMVAKASRENSGGGEGVVVEKNEPYEKDGVKGQYTFKRLFIASRVPGMIRAILPKDALILEEEAWNAYPYFKTIYKNVWMKENFYLIIESFHIPGTPIAEAENPLKLPADELKIRTVIECDIAQMDKKKAKEYKTDCDPTTFRSTKTGRGPIQEGWYKDNSKLILSSSSSPPSSSSSAANSNPFAAVSSNSSISATSPKTAAPSPPPPGPTTDLRVSSLLPVTTAYKCCKMYFKWFGLQSIVESYAINLCKTICTNAIRQQFCWMDEYYGWTMDDVAKYENEEIEKTKKAIQEAPPVVSADDEE